MLIFDQLKRNERHLQVLSAIVLVGMGLLVTVLWFLQVVSAKRFQANLEKQSFRTVRVPAVRGKILDCNGAPLAENRPSYNVNLYLEDLRKEFQDEYHRLRPRDEAGKARRLTRSQIDALARASRYSVVSNMITQAGSTLRQPLQLDPVRFQKHYDQRLALPLPVLENVSSQQIALFAERSDNMPGMNLEIQASRLYPAGSAVSHLLGHLQRFDGIEDETEIACHYRLPDYRGVFGIEAVFDEQLRGKPGVKSMLVNNLGYRQSENILLPAEPGRNVVLTVDVNLQQAAEKALRSVGMNTRGAAVVMDPANGDLLAVVSTPAFDPNKFVPRIDAEDWEKYNDEKLKPLINRATQGRYPPGSIFKIIVGLAALEAGTLNPSDKYTVIPDPLKPGRGCIYVGRRKIDDTAEPGEYDFRRAFKRSSNAYFIDTGMRAKVSRIVEMGHRFHLGEKCNIPTRQDDGGEFPTAQELSTGWFDGDTANLCIGQGFIAVTPVQMAVMTSAIANGGKVFWPRLVDRIEPLDPLSRDETERFPAGQLRDEIKVAPRNLDIIREGMFADVEDLDGTGRPAAVAGMKIGGKTGTAQVTRGRLVIDHITWFVSYGSPVNEPQRKYVVVVMVESGGSGGGTCAPAAKQIYDAILKRERQAHAHTDALAQNF